MADNPARYEDTAFEEADIFLRARFAGGRFDSHAIPFEVLSDLATYRSLIIEVAKMLFKKRNNNRERVPKGFEDSFQIGLVKVRGGESATAVACRLPVETPTRNQYQMPFPAYQEFDEARDYVDDLIRRVGSTGFVPADFPTELAGRFNPFGQSLQSDEYVELSHGTSPPIRYDTFIRKKIVLSREKTYENSLDAMFMLNGGVHDTSTIHVLDMAGASFDFRPLTDSEFARAMARGPSQVRLVGTGLYDTDERLRRLLDVRVIFDDGPRQSYIARLIEIAGASAGWYDGANPAPAASAVDAMRGYLDLIVDQKGVLAPYLYPTPEGGVVAEWSIGTWEANAIIAAEGTFIELHAIDTSTQAELTMNCGANAPDLADHFDRFWKRIYREGTVPDAS